MTGLGWAPVRHFAERSVLGLIAVVAAGLGFGSLLLLVRYHWSPLLHLDQSVAAGLNRVVAVPFAVKVCTTILLGAARISVAAYAFRVWRREAGRPTPSPAAGLEPEAAADLGILSAGVVPRWAEGADAWLEAGEGDGHTVPTGLGGAEFGPIRLDYLLLGGGLHASSARVVRDDPFASDQYPLVVSGTGRRSPENCAQRSIDAT